MTKCPKCKKRLNFAIQVADWDGRYGDEWNGQAMINIICPYCKEGVMIVSLVMYDETEDVKSPALGNKVVKVPKIK